MYIHMHMHAQREREREAVSRLIQEADPSKKTRTSAWCLINAYEQVAVARQEDTGMKLWTNLGDNDVRNMLRSLALREFMAIPRRPLTSLWPMGCRMWAEAGL